MAASSINGAAAQQAQPPGPSTASNGKSDVTHLWITQRWSVLLDGDHVRYFPVKPPGEPLTGQVPVADALYPAITYSHGPAPKPR